MRSLLRALGRGALVAVLALALVTGAPSRTPRGTPIVTIPPAALAAGYTYRTYGPNVNLSPSCTAGQNCWFLFNALGVTPIGGQAVQNGDGSITLPGNDGSGYGANVSTAHFVSGVLKGTSFKTGYYIEFVVKFTPTLGSAALPFPALWSLDTGFLTNSYQWPGQAPGFHHRIENDFFQWPHNSTAFLEGNGLIDWYGTSTANVTQPANGEISFSGSFASYQRYGFLVTPATGSSQGSIVNYVNDVQVAYAAGASNTTWNLYSAGNAPPPVAGSTAGSLIDTLQMVLIMGTDSTCPMTINQVSVWQRDASGATTSSLVTPFGDAANDDFYERKLAA